MADSGDVKVGGGYVQIGVDVDPLKDGLDDAAKHTKNSLKNISDLALDFAKKMSGALGVAIPAGGIVGTVTGMVSAGVRNDTALGRLMSIAGQRGGDVKALDNLQNQMRITLQDKVAMTEADARNIMATGLQSGFIGAKGENTNRFFELVARMALIGGVPATQAAQDAAASFMGGTDLGKYGVFTPPGMFPHVQFGQLEERMNQLEPTAQAISQLPSSKIGRFGAKFMQGLADMAGDLPGMQPGGSFFRVPPGYWNDETSLDITTGSGLHLPSRLIERSAGSFQGPAAFNRDLNELVGLFKAWIHENRTVNQGT